MHCVSWPPDVMSYSHEEVHVEH